MSETKYSSAYDQRSDIQRFQEIDGEQGRRKKEDGANYLQLLTPRTPTNFPELGIKANDQEGFYLSPAKFRFARGGNRSTKTTTGMYDATQFGRGVHPVRTKHRKPPVNIRVCAPSIVDNIEAVILPKLSGLIPRSELAGKSWASAYKTKDRILRLGNGSRFKFLSFEQTVDKFAGTDEDAVYSDEHGSIRHFRENMARLADRNGYYVQTMTPELGSATWEKRIFREIRSKGITIQEWQWSIFGNPHISREGVETFLASLGGDEQAIKIKAWGEYAALAGAVYYDFSESRHVLTERRIYDTWDRVFVIDPHLKKETAMIWAVWTPDDELIVYRSFKKKMDVESLKRFIRLQTGSEHIALWICDEAMGGTGTNIFGQASVVEQLSVGDNALPILPTNQSSNKAFEAGVMKVRSMLRPHTKTGRPSLYILDTYRGVSNQGVIDEFVDYQFLPDEKGDEKVFRDRVRKIDDDYLDCIRYAAMSRAADVGAEIESDMGDDWLTGGLHG